MKYNFENIYYVSYIFKISIHSLDESERYNAGYITENFANFHV